MLCLPELDEICSCIPTSEFVLLFVIRNRQVENLESGCTAVKDQGDAAGRHAAAQVHLNPARLFQGARGGLPTGRKVAVENQGRGGAVGPDAADAAAMV